MRAAWIVWAAALALALSSCGYATGFTVPDSKTIGVAIFDNDSKERDIEAELHAALTDSLDRMVGARVVDPDQADLVITGDVTEFARRSGIRNQNNVRLENGLRITVQARLVERTEEPQKTPGPAKPGVPSKSRGKTKGGLVDRYGEVIRQVTVSDDRGFLIEDPVGESDARSRVLRNIADRVVLDLFSDLAYEAQPGHGP